MRVVTIFGSNAGDKFRIMEEATVLLSEKVGKTVLFSSYYETEPWGFECKENFLNRIIVFETILSPEEFLQACLDTERQLGRIRTGNSPRYTSRPIDIDILFYGDQIIHSPGLIIPHPRLAERNFVLTPLNEIMPGFIHPEYNQTIQVLLKKCQDKLKTTQID